MLRDHAENWNDGLRVDFSAESEKKDELKRALLQQLRQSGAARHNIEKEYSSMNKTNTKRFKRSTIIALAACLTVVLSATAYAVVNYLNLGKHAQYMMDSRDASEQSARMEEPLPAELQGSLYDKNGKVIETIGEMQNDIYNSEGEAVITTSDASGALVIVTQEEAREKQMLKTTLFTGLEDAQTYLAFKAKSLPYIPAGYELEGYRIFNDENGKPYQDIKYLEMYLYKIDNADEYVYIQVRLMDEETAFASSASNDLKKTSINGYEAIVDGNNIDILIGDVMYMIAGRNLPQSEVLKMAESLSK